ncbi:hypothetical protein ACIOHS_12750 [Streptomyces sp. NPDC088253]|uniref:hypothetical protein n=1 Tax=Streptomyces sp. NPDC088253 TaxID=3365846 RepID=UPI0038145251
MTAVTMGSGHRVRISWRASRETTRCSMVPSDNSAASSPHASRCLEVPQAAAACLEPLA